jgi:hypothetical protein
MRAHIRFHALSCLSTLVALACSSPASNDRAASALRGGTSSPTATATGQAENAARDARIRLDAPAPQALVRSPLEIRGEARGGWFFEASFPVKLLDASGHVLAQTHADAQGEWMTEAFVPFRAQLEFAAPSAQSGTLVLEKSNPSDLPQNAGELRVPVRFDAIAGH